MLSAITQTFCHSSTWFFGTENGALATVVNKNDVAAQGLYYRPGLVATVRIEFGDYPNSTEQKQIQLPKDLQRHYEAALQCIRSQTEENEELRRQLHQSHLELMIHMLAWKLQV